MVRVKICGITNRSDAECAALNGADAIGFVFAKSARRIALPVAAEIVRAVGPWIATVGVFVNDKPDQIIKAVETCRLSVVQLHGQESAALIKRLQKFPVKVVKTFHVGPDFDWRDAEKSEAHAVLFDTQFAAAAGGTGKVFKWSVLKGAQMTKQFIISGGLNPGNVREAIKTFSPYGVDVSSGVERSPGKKDPEFVKEFIFNAKKP